MKGCQAPGEAWAKPENTMPAPGQLLQHSARRTLLPDLPTYLEILDLLCVKLPVF